MAVIFKGKGGGASSSRALALALRLAINAAALWVAAQVVSGAVNAFIKPAAHFLGCPLTCLTAGLFALVINAAMLALAAWIAGHVNLNVQIDGFWAAFWGALLVSIVSALLTAFVGRPLKRPSKK